MAGGNLDLQGFVTKPDDADWLYQIAADKRRNREFDERVAERKQTQQEKEDATLAANTRFIENNEKQKLTGTLYDPVNTQLISKLNSQSLQLLQQKVPLDQVLLAGAPIADQIHEYNQKAEMYNASWKQFADANKNVKGLNLDELKKEADKTNFYDIDPKTGQPTLNVDKAKPDFNYNDVIRTSDNPNIFNNEGLNEYVKTSGHTVNDQIVKRRDVNGRTTMVKGDMTMPSFMQPTQDAQGFHTGFEPKHNIVIDGDAALLHTFKDDKGNDVQAPVKTVTDDVWKGLPTQVRARFIQETRQLIAQHPDKHINIDSPQAENLGKAIAYDELKNNSKDYSTFKRTDVNMFPLPPRMTTNIYGNQVPPTVNLYPTVDKIVSDDVSKGVNSTRFNKLPASAQTTILKIARDNTGDKNLNYGDIYLAKDKDGTLNVMQQETVNNVSTPRTTDKVIFPLDAESLNVPANQQIFKLAGTKGKTAAANTIDISTSNKSATGGNTNYTIKGKSYSHADLIKGGWTDELIDKAKKAGKIK